MARVDAASAGQWKPLARMRTHEQVIAEIENRLITGRLRAGDRLPPERQLAEALGVSRGAVREALRILEAIGVVEAGTGSGPSSGSTIVSDGVAGMAMVLRLHLRLASFGHDDLVEIRLLILRLAASRAADLATEEDLAGLQALVDEMRGGDAAACDAAEAAFHRRIVGLADNALAGVLLGALQQAGPPVNEAVVDRVDAPRPEAYSSIVAALADGDGDRAGELLAATGGWRADGSSALQWAG